MTDILVTKPLFNTDLLKRGTLIRVKLPWPSDDHRPSRLVRNALVCSCTSTSLKISYIEYDEEHDIPMYNTPFIIPIEEVTEGNNKWIIHPLVPDIPKEQPDI